MAILPIIKAPDPRLKRRSEPVAVVDRDVRRQLADMLETMYAAPGVGLSAIQVGVARRLIVIDVAKAPDAPAPLKLINPEIIEQSGDTILTEEGCLSFPEQFAEVTRPTAVVVRYLDEQGEIRTLRADGLLARCLQHEIDHLEGKVFVEYLSPLKRGMILRKMAKVKRLAPAEA
ncbi:MAG: peptide deformylase [Alphaproteobacteria bacterium]|nr:peptide deformylase [Alphaproteobacteria bacterium]